MKCISKLPQDLIGNTPLVELFRLEKYFDLNSHLFVKVEKYNLAGSTKDRVALQMIEDAQDCGLLHAGDTIIEPTSGNTGIGLAAVGGAKGYRVIIIMPDNMSIERQKIIKSYGAQVVLTDGKLGMKGSIEKAKALSSQISNSYIPSQFDNPSNSKAHYLTTGPEIYHSLNAKVDAFVAGVGTGGTITGVGKYLKEKINDVFICAIEPASSPLLNGGSAGAHHIEGIGANFIPDVLDTDIYDEVIDVEDNQAIEYAKLLNIEESLSVGISSGAALYGAVSLAKRAEFRNKNIVALLPDGADRYMSTPLYE